MSDIVDVVIIGAGPYGLSMGAHLAARGISFRMFGSPMHAWRTSMPEGMVLKSEGFASNISDPSGEFTLKRFCAERGIAYKDMGLPIKLTTFIDYGVAFQKKYVPHLEEKQVTNVAQARYGFDVTLEDGEVAQARRVIVAAGIRGFDYIPPELASLPKDMVSHAADHVKVDQFAGKQVAVVGGGASAINLAALMHQKGADVTILVRDDKVEWCGAPAEMTLMDKLRSPISGLGTGWRSWACCAMPMVFYAMPEKFRVMVVDKHLPAAPGWTLRDQVEGKVKIITGASIIRSDAEGNRVKLNLKMADGATRQISVDHVAAGTGYRVDTRRLGFFGPEISGRMKTVNHSPVLSGQFESTVPGLYFIGTTAAYSFGPMLRFVYGAKFACARISRHLQGSLKKQGSRPVGQGTWQQKPATLARG